MVVATVGSGGLSTGRPAALTSVTSTTGCGPVSDSSAAGMFG